MLPLLQLQHKNVSISQLLVIFHQLPPLSSRDLRQSAAVPFLASDVIIPRRLLSFFLLKDSISAVSGAPRQTDQHETPGDGYYDPAVGESQRCPRSRERRPAAAGRRQEA